MPKVTRHVSVPKDLALLIWDGKNRRYSVEFGSFGIINLRDYEKVLEISDNVPYLSEKKLALQAVADIMFA